MQTKKQSLIETFTNIGIGFAISLIATFIIFPIFNIESTPGKNIGITIFYTAISLIRNYVIRRFFNKTSKNRHLHFAQFILKKEEKFLNEKLNASHLIRISDAGYYLKQFNKT